MPYLHSISNKPILRYPEQASASESLFDNKIYTGIIEKIFLLVILQEGFNVPLIPVN